MMMPNTPKPPEELWNSSSITRLYRGLLAGGRLLRMQYRLRNWAVSVSVLVALLATGCGGAFVERVAGWYITRKIDGLFDLESEQKSWVRGRVDGHLESIRAGELEKAIALLEDTRAVMARGATDDSIRKLQDRSDALMDSFVRRMAPDTAHLLAGLSSEQVDHFASEMRDALKDSYEDVKLSASERRAQADEKFVERMEDILGELSAEQRAMFLPTARKIAEERPRQYKSGLKRIDTVAAKLKAKPGKQAIQQGLLDMWDRRYAAIGERTREQRRASQREFLLRIDRSLSVEQRAHAVEYVDGRLAQLKRFRAK